MKRRSWEYRATSLAIAALAACMSAGLASASPRPEIITSDVDSFFRLYDATNGHPTAEQLDHDYLQPGSQPLHEFAKARNVTGAHIADTLAKRPEVYAGARRCLAVLPQVKTRLATALGKLVRLYPEARLPPVSIVVGRGKPVGITSASGVTMGLEALCSADFMDPDLTDRFVHTISHEYGHIQQPAELGDLEPGDPRATVLRMSLMEGTGEFVAELISGGVGNYQHAAWTRGKEVQIGEAFLRDQDSLDLKAWMYNGPGDAAHPNDLGYWVGYRVIKAYYARARDKRAALKAIFEMKDPKAFLAQSGWRPGM